MNVNRKNKSFLFFLESNLKNSVRVLFVNDGQTDRESESFRSFEVVEAATHERMVANDKCEECFIVCHNSKVEILG